MVSARDAANLGRTASVYGIRVMLDYAAQCGVDVPALLAEIRLERDVLAHPDHRISLRALLQAWELASERSGDPSFGLHAAELAVVGTFEALDYALWASATLQEVFDRLQRFYRVIGDDLAVDIVRTGKLVRIRRVSGPDFRHRIEAALAIVTARGRELTGRAFRLHEVCFVHPAPADTRPHRAVFRCPVRFGCGASEIVMAADQLQLPVRTTRPGLAVVLDRHLREIVAKLPREETFLHRVEHAVARTLHVGRPSLEATARALHASPRTVQRHLQQLGVSHREIVDDVRREMAQRLLASRRMSISEIAFLLGFEDVSGFRRAYRKWTGASPSRGRKG